MSTDFLTLRLRVGNETRLYRVVHVNSKSLTLNDDINCESVLVSSSVMNKLLLDNTIQCQIVKRYAKDKIYKWIAILSIF